MAGVRGIAIYAGTLALALALFLLFPQIDLATSRLFYTSDHGFALAGWPPVVFLYKVVPWLTWGILAFAALAGLWLFLMRRSLWRLDGKWLVFLVASMALGPGFLTNTVLKDHSGRARPSQVEAFGGSHLFTPAPLPAAECRSNCAFVSGHAALAFSLVAFAFLLPAARLRRRATATALSIGAVVGLGRIAQGAHFLSDVVFAGFLVYGTTALLYWWVIERDGLATPMLVRVYAGLERGAGAGWELARRHSRARAVRFLLVIVAAMIVIAISIGFLDRPLTLFFHAHDPDLRAVFDITGRLGLTYGYLIFFGLAFVALHWGGALPRLQSLADRLRAFSAIPAFLWLSIASSGVVVDILKFLCGRTRPKLLFNSGVSDFVGLELRPDHWSFPSGHSATIVALATALWFVWPQHILFYILVAAIVSLSRVAVGAHYLSDVLAGALIATFATWGVALIFARSGIDLSAARRWRSTSSSAPWPCRRFGRASIVSPRTDRPNAGRIARSDGEECNIGPSADCGPRIGSTSWPCASRPSTIPAAGTLSTRP